MKPTSPTHIRTTPITSRLTELEVSLTPHVRIAPMAMMSRLTMNPMSAEYPRCDYENQALRKKRKSTVDHDRLAADHLRLRGAQEGHGVGDVLLLHHAVPRACAFAQPRSICSRLGKWSSAPVSTTPPETAFTRIPLGASSTAR